MRTPNEEQPTQVEGLRGFPFKTFEEFKKSATGGVVQASVHAQVPWQWVQMSRVPIVHLTVVPFYAAIAITIYALATRQWLMLLDFPVLLLGLAIFHSDPQAYFFQNERTRFRARVIQTIRHGTLGLAFAGLVYGLLNRAEWIAAFAFTLIIIWLTQRIIDWKVLRGLREAFWGQEDLACLLWNSGALKLRLANGNAYLVDCKKEDGKCSLSDHQGISSDAFEQKSSLENLLLASATAEEISSGKISSTRLAEIKLNSELWPIPLH